MDWPKERSTTLDSFVTSVVAVTFTSGKVSNANTTPLISALVHRIAFAVWKKPANTVDAPVGRAPNVRTVLRTFDAVWTRAVKN